MVDWIARDKQNIEHADNPKPGDYWEEMFSGQYMIVAVTPELVALCQEKVSVGPDHWSFDLEKITVMTRSEFGKLVRYKGTALTNKTWCDVRPEQLLCDVAEAAKAADRALRTYKRNANPSWLSRLIKQIRAAMKVRLQRLVDML
jgi:hypothetical protein